MGALQPTNYVLSEAPRLRRQPSGVIAPDPLTTTPLTFGTRYTVTLNHLTDRARAANPLPPDTRANFIAAELVSGGVGGSTASDAVVPLEGGGYAVTSGDMESRVCPTSFNSHGNSVSAISTKGPCGRIGPVRCLGAGLSDGSRTRRSGCSIRGSRCHSEPRRCVLRVPFRRGRRHQSQWSLSGKLSNTWLRLRRVGNTFTGYASFNGRLDFARVHNPGTAGRRTGRFGHSGPRRRSFGHRPLPRIGRRLRRSRVTSGINLPVEPPGPSSRKTGLAITEIMFQPAARQDGKDLAFVELFNSNPWPEDVSGYRLDGDFLCSFPAGTSIAGGGFLVVAASPADLESTYGITGTVGPFLRSPTPKGVLRLQMAAMHPQSISRFHIWIFNPGALRRPAPDTHWCCRVRVMAKVPWRLECERPPRRFARLSQSIPPGALHNVVINELLAHPGAGQVGFVEFYNHGNEDLDLGGCRLSDYPGTHEVVLPSPTHLPARGFVSFNQNQLGFTPNRAGGSLYLLTPDGEQILDLVTYEAQEQGIALGRVPEGVKNGTDCSPRPRRPQRKRLVRR